VHASGAHLTGIPRYPRTWNRPGIRPAGDQALVDLSATGLDCNSNSGFRAESREQPLEVTRIKGNAAGGPRPVGSRNVHKYCAAPPRHARAYVVIDLDDEVV
jgi:hypothetical protein